MHYSYDHGFCYIPDEVYLSLGFPADIDAYGNSKIKTAGISQENQQQAKYLTGDTKIASQAKRNANIEL